MALSSATLPAGAGAGAKRWGGAKHEYEGSGEAASASAATAGITTITSVAAIATAAIASVSWRNCRGVVPVDEPCRAD